MDFRPDLKSHADRKVRSGWPGRCRRLSKDFEADLTIGESWIRTAMIRVMERRLVPP